MGCDEEYYMSTEPVRLDRELPFRVRFFVVYVFVLHELVARCGLLTAVTGNRIGNEFMGRSWPSLKLVTEGSVRKAIARGMGATVGQVEACPSDGHIKNHNFNI